MTMTDLLPRAVICVENPQDYISQLKDYSIMVINPNTTRARQQYLLDQSDYSLLITATEVKQRSGGRYAERLFWYTSGTTGDSKFYSFTQDQVDIMARNICAAYDITANDRYTSIMPLWHAHGQGFYWATQLAACETSYLSVNQLRNINQTRPTFVTAIPDILQSLLKTDLKNLRFVRSASSALPEKLYQQLHDRFQIPVINAFGMTEALSHCFTNPLHGEQRMGTIGLPDGIQAKIVDGHLHIQGPTLFTDQWIDTGDLAEQDSAGYYRILGRGQDQINIRGIKINPVSLENQLLESVLGIDHCVIFGQQRINCVYVGTCRPEEIKVFLTSLGSWCRPSMIRSVDSIPLNDSGKISRNYLNQYYLNQ